MKSAHPFAIEAAVKFAQSAFPTKAAAVASLRRKCPGLGSDAATMFDKAALVYKSALGVVGDVTAHLFATWERKKEVGPKDVEYLVPTLAQKHPDWSRRGLRAALWSATVYHLR